MAKRKPTKTKTQTVHLDTFDLTIKCSGKKVIELKNANQKKLESALAKYGVLNDEF